MSLNQAVCLQPGSGYTGGMVRQGMRLIRHSGRSVMWVLDGPAALPECLVSV